MPLLSGGKGPTLAQRFAEGCHGPPKGRLIARSTPILGSGGLLAALDPEQNDHEASSSAALTGYTRRLLAISSFVVVELYCTILHDYGREDRLAFLEGVG